MQEESQTTEGQFVSHKFELFNLKVDSDKDSTHFLFGENFLPNGTVQYFQWDRMSV